MIIGLDASRANVAQRTGTERYAWEVLRRMVVNLNDHQVRLYVREPLRADWPTLPVNVEVRVLNWRLGFLWTHLRLSWELIWHRPDLLFVPADTVPLVHPTRTFTTIHDIAFERFPELYRGKSVQRRLGMLRPLVHLLVRIVTLGRYSASERDYHRWSARQAVQTCQRIFTVSEFSKKEIAEVYHVSPERISVIPLGVDQPEVFSSITPTERQAILQQLDLKQPFFLFTGRLEKKKNIELLLRSYQVYLEQATTPIDLVLVGNPGFGWDELLTLRENPIIKPHLHVLGWQSDEVVNVLRCTASAMVLLSQYEGFGLPVLEAMSAGVPVICSKHASLPEIAGAGAVFVDTNDPNNVAATLNRIVKDDALRQQVIAYGFKRVRQFTWDQTAKLTQQLMLA